MMRNTVPSKLKKINKNKRPNFYFLLLNLQCVYPHKNDHMDDIQLY